MFLEIVLAGLMALKEYIALHVLTCLIPAFFLAGAMVTFIEREVILSYLGESQNRLKSFSLACIASFLVAACSCTVIPVASGLYYAGAGIGPACIVLWVAPAANILALTYTGSILGLEMVLSRIVVAISMAFLVGATMSFIFQKESHQKPLVEQESGEKKAMIKKQHIILLLLLVLTLLLPNYLIAKGTYIGKVVIWGSMSFVTAVYAWLTIEKKPLYLWFRETWWFVRIIFPLLLLGVFLVGVISKLLPEEWIREWLGGNGIVATFLAILLGSVSYFATLTEAPFVDTLMNMGMGKGPALALLLTGPGISLPNWLAVGRVFGFKKAFVYVPTIMVLGTILSWVFGNYIL